MSGAIRLTQLGRGVAAVALVVLIAMVLAVAPTTATASAHTTSGSATPGNDGAHPWPTDGCSTPGANVNAIAGIFDFGHACKHHDGCYIGFPRNGAATYWTSRSQCDAWFLYDMQASCRWQHGPDPATTWIGRQRQQWASNYLWAVRAYGASGYKGPSQ